MPQTWREVFCQQILRVIEIILQVKPEINAETVKDMIEEKKRTVGAGYLTDQGALFLVAADLGICLTALRKKIPHSRTCI